MIVDLVEPSMRWKSASMRFFMLAMQLSLTVVACTPSKERFPPSLLASRKLSPQV